MTEGTDTSYGTITVGGTAVLLRTGRTARKALIVQNVHATNILYLGDDASVTTANGLKVAAGETRTVPTRGDVYGIASAASTDVRYFEVS